MASRPAKRQRRSTRVLSDDDDEYPPASDLPVRTPKAQRQLSLDNGGGAITLSPSSTRTHSLQSTPKKSGKASPRTSPDKTRKSTRLKEPEISKSLHSFFGKASEEQRWQRNKSNTPEVVLAGDDLDAIVDDDLSDEALLALEESASSTSALDRRKSMIKPVTNGMGTSNGRKFVKPSIPFKRPNAPSESPSVRTEQESFGPWSERYGPTKLDELAIHKKKVSDVQQWLDGVTSGRLRQRLLVLKGPAGSGKTATVGLIARELGLSPVFWQNPGVVDTATGGSVAAQFDDFLNRGGQFGTLGLTAAHDTETAAAAERQLLIVEEFPTSMARSAESFRTVVSRFLARGSPGPAQPFKNVQHSSVPTFPVVMIISETLLSSSTAFSDSFTAHRLLGPEILNHSSTNVIEFNPVAQTFIHKALDLVVRKEARDSLRRRIPGPAVMQRLAEMGDVRNAVNALEFLCVRNDSSSDWSGTVAGKSKKSAKDSANLTAMERDSLKLVSQRETTLDMFHAAGKVVYNKREDPRVADLKAEPPPKPPDHLMHLYTPKVSQVDIEALFNETGTDIQTFISSLHENYALSCNGDSFVETFTNCAAALSVSDTLNPESRRSLRSKTGNAAVNYSAMQTGGTDSLRQDEISFNVAARGLLFHLPHPVNRAAPSSGRSADKFKMFYPTSLRLWRPTEEVDSLISLFTHDKSLLNEGLQSSVGGVASWKNTSFGPSHSALEDLADETVPPRRALPSRDDLVADVLPYLARIKLARKEDTKLIDRITQIQNLSMPLSGEEPDDEQPKEEIIVGATKVRGSFSTAAATSQLRRPAGSVTPNQMAAPLSRGSQSRGDDSTSSQMENLFLADDDIIDD
ncbi:uncharacterized protein HMPREF1541_05327 [Cyphellophora europaea CBS 101466]|uniref:AAA+ ATPase domain-containing protein n=1 Tax=Cyphellophora europaea (strain CBS 101466) TaxID=1220924 RepID=W2RS19_CYPE1|nr:uncharacterized protein HMPREF1541_05327 [Cyphellophora europaea CBS 101466]ETN39105.1 hypothetical protein HMPREF1541_05327 [Cyphellophora europaea CBS 101466]